MYNNDVENKSIERLFGEVRQTISDLAEKINTQTLSSTNLTNAVANDVQKIDILIDKIDKYVIGVSTANVNISNNYDNIVNSLKEIKTSLITITEINNKLEFKLFKILLYGTVIYTIIGLFFTLYQSGIFTISGG